MKKTFIIFITIFSCLIILKPLSCYAHDRDMIYLEYSDAPEGTAYIDLLAKFKEDDDAYTEFNIPPLRPAEGKGYESLSVDENSEIAKYCEDGYASLTVHSKNIGSFVVHKYQYGLETLSIKGNVNDFYSKYKKFKLAYVGENGEVLKVTSKAGKAYLIKNMPDTFAANGKKAVFKREFSSGTWSIIFIVIFLIIAVSAVLLTKMIRKKVISSETDITVEK